MALITYLTRIQFDFGALKLLEAELQLLGMRRPLIVTDKGVIAAGLWAKVKETCPATCRSRFMTARRRTRPKPRCAMR